jgi:hypothetical protein
MSEGTVVVAESGVTAEAVTAPVEATPVVVETPAETVAPKAKATKPKAAPKAKATKAPVEEAPKTVKLTTNEFAAREGVEYIQASGLLKFLHAKKLITVAGTVKASGATGKGKPSTVYEVPLTLTLTLKAA